MGTSGRVFPRDVTMTGPAPGVRRGGSGDATTAGRPEVTRPTSRW